MKVVNRLFKFVAILATQIFYSFGLYTIALALTGSVCTLIFVVSEMVGFKFPFSVWKVWFILSVPVWLGFEAYVGIKVYRIIHKK